MAITVYWGSGSAFAWRALLALEVKSVPYESKLLSFADKQTQTPEFLRLNPRGKVPVLDDNGHVVYESLAILYYLDCRYPKPPLYGRNPQEAGRVMQSICEQGAYLEPNLYDLVRAVFQGRVEEQRETVSAQLPALTAELGGFDARLAQQPWLAGEVLSAADLALYPNLQLLRRALAREAAASLAPGLRPFDERFAGIARWNRAVESLPGYERTYPPHWR